MAKKKILKTKVGKTGEHTFIEFCQTIAALRHPRKGCPWDLKQDHLSLRRYMIEEAYEAVDAMSDKNSARICEELGDVLLQVVLNAQIAKDRGVFDIDDVVKSIDQKMRRRHPHVFEAKSKLNTPEQVRRQWEEIKKREKMATASQKKSLFADEARPQDPLRQAILIGKKARKINFDWDGPLAVWDAVKSEIHELDEELRKKKKPQNKIARELGDVYFTLAQLCRHLDFDPLVIAADGNRKFLKRFEKMEEMVQKKKRKIIECSKKDLEALWNVAKKSEKKT